MAVARGAAWGARGVRSRGRFSPGLPGAVSAPRAEPSSPSASSKWASASEPTPKPVAARNSRRDSGRGCMAVTRRCAKGKVGRSGNRRGRIRRESVAHSWRLLSVASVDGEYSRLGWRSDEMESRKARASGDIFSVGRGVRIRPSMAGYPRWRPRAFRDGGQRRITAPASVAKVLQVQRNRTDFRWLPPENQRMLKCGFVFGRWECEATGVGTGQGVARV